MPRGKAKIDAAGFLEQLSAEKEQREKKPQKMLTLLAKSRACQNEAMRIASSLCEEKTKRRPRKNSTNGAETVGDAEGV